MCSLFWQCSSRLNYKVESEKNNYSLNQLLSIGCYDNYDELIRFIHDGQAKDEISAYEAADWCAYFTFYFSQDYSKVIEFCEQAKAALHGSDDFVHLMRTLELQIRASYESGDIYSCLELCSKSIEIAHQHNYYFDIACVDFIVGKCQFDCDLYDEGFSLMNDAVNRALNSVKLEREYEALVYCVIKLLGCHCFENDTEQILKITDVLEKLLVEMGTKYPDMKTSCRISVYYKCQYFMYLGRAVAKASLGQLSEAEEDFNRCRELEFSSWNSNNRYQIDYYMVKGVVDSVLRINERCPFRYGDTISWPYQMRIARLERAYRVAGDTVMADLYAYRMDTLADIIEKREQEEGWAVMAMRYGSKHFQLALSDLKKTFVKDRRKVYGIVFSVVLASMVLIGIQYFITRRRIKAEKALLQKAQTMEEEMAKLQKQVRLIARRDKKMNEGEGDEDNSLLASFVEDQELYLKKDISRSLVADLMGCSQRTMTKMLDEIHPGLSFPDYIRSLRIRHALKVISENPNYSVQQVADESGFYSISSFERAFKAVTGKTPKAYLKEKAESHVDDDQNEESRPQSGDGSQS